MGTRKIFQMTAILLVASASIAQAAPSGYCQKYANDAAYQYHKMRITPSCQRAPNNLWHGDKGLHYSWCLSASIGSTKAQILQRDHLLAKCDPSYGD